MADTIGVALTKCFYCGENSDILMNTILTKHIADKVKDCHGKVVSMKPCTQCKTYMEMGIILLTYDNEKSKGNDIYRTGGFFVVREEAVTRWYKDKETLDKVLEGRFTFIEHNLAEKMGLFNSIN